MVCAVPPEVTARAEASVRTPAELKLEVAVAPKAQLPRQESAVVEAFAKVARPVKVGAAEKTRVPLPVSSERRDEIPAEVVRAETTPEEFVWRSPEGEPEIVRFVVLAVPKWLVRKLARPVLSMENRVVVAVAVELAITKRY